MSESTPLQSILIQFPGLRSLTMNGILLDNEKTGRLPALDVSALPFKLNLENLELWYFSLPQFPEFILGFDSLKALSMLDCDLEELPDGIDRLERLEMINCGNNHLTSLPFSVTRLRNLRFFYLSNNFFTTLPSCLSRMDSLQVLALENNYNIYDTLEMSRKRIPYTEESAKLNEILSRNNLRKLYISVTDGKEKKKVRSLLPDSLQPKLEVFPNARLYIFNPSLVRYILEWNVGYFDFDYSSFNQLITQNGMPKIPAANIYFIPTLGVKYKRTSILVGTSFLGGIKDIQGDTSTFHKTTLSLFDFQFDLLRGRRITLTPVAGVSSMAFRYDFVSNDTLQSLGGYLTNTTVNKTLNYNNTNFHLGLKFQYHTDNHYMLLKTGIFLPGGKGYWDCGDKTIINDAGTEIENRFYILIGGGIYIKVKKNPSK